MPIGLSVYAISEAMRSRVAIVGAKELERRFLSYTLNKDALRVTEEVLYKTRIQKVELLRLIETIERMLDMRIRLLHRGYFVPINYAHFYILFSPTKLWLKLLKYSAANADKAIVHLQSAVSKG